MNRQYIWIMGIAALLLLGAQDAGAQDEDSARALEQAELKQEYENALVAAEQEREAALDAVRRARLEMEGSSEERARREAEAARAEHLKAQALASSELEEERAAMREELSRAHEELRRASREVARVHRELEMPRGMLAPSASLINLGDKAVIGVILGDSDESGAQVLGVSPDGPAERAGILQGDVIVAIEGEPLATADGENAGLVMHELMEGVEVGDDLLITVDRDGETLEYTVTAELREPFGWASIVRLPSVPHAPGAPVIIERIEVPEIDREKLEEKMRNLREEIERARVVIETRRGEGLHHVPETWAFEFDNLSEIGGEAMMGANLWFGMPMTRGLKMAEIDRGLGEYFKTDRGVLVLKAKEDNELQLQSGDVILEVGGTAVDKPADVMRALRGLKPGSDLVIGIIRDRKNRSIEIVVPESKAKFGFAPDDDLEHIYHYSAESH
jgi:hypothetical protein